MKEQLLYELLGLIPVQPGAFNRVNTSGEAIELNKIDNRAVLSVPFELGRFTVTNLVWSLVTDEPLDFEPMHPKTNVSWFDAVEFCRKLNEKLGLPLAIKGSAVELDFELDHNSEGFRLPTSDEWEYACRADDFDDIFGPWKENSRPEGTDEAGPWAQACFDKTCSSYAPVDDIAWHSGNSFGMIHHVGEKKPNSWGFYDMLGNAWEWCWDWYTYFDLRQMENNSGFRIVRGGAWSTELHSVNPVTRSCKAPNKQSPHGSFRLARTLPQAG
jgi:formylglycine-generating enzyme required for sulfatase activity